MTMDVRDQYLDAAEFAHECAAAAEVLERHRDPAAARDAEQEYVLACREVRRLGVKLRRMGLRAVPARVVASSSTSPAAGDGPQTYSSEDLRELMEGDAA